MPLKKAPMCGRNVCHFFYLLYILLYLSLIIFKWRKQKETEPTPKQQKMFTNFVIYKAKSKDLKMS